MSRLASVFAAISVVAAMTGGVALFVGPESPPETDGRPSDRTEFDDYTDVHAAGVTGENVTVGIVDATGFDVDAAQYADAVVAARSFGDGKTLANGGLDNHGTAVAATVATVAPDSDLYLAAVAEETDYRAALAWLDDRDVDVVVVPTSFYGKPGDGSGRSARATTQLARDAVVVTASGNIGQRYWQGAYEGTNGSMPVRNPDTGERVRVVPGDDRTRLWLSWGPLDERHRLRLVRNGSTVATSRPYPDDDVPNERIDRELSNGTYSLVVDGPAADTGTRLRLQVPAGHLAGGRPAGSLVAPATARGVVVVGGFDPTSGQVPAYSSRGPTADGRPGVDVVGPTRPPAPEVRNVSGTSYAAAYVAGISALVIASDARAAPASVERRLERTAIDIERPGREDATGHGLVDPGGAVLDVSGNTTR